VVVRLDLEPRPGLRAGAYVAADAARMPFADLKGFEKNPELGKLSDLFTVDLITRYIEGKLQNRN